MVDARSTNRSILNIFRWVKHMSGKRKILFLYPDVAAPTLRQINCGQVPSERLYGLVEMMKRNWEAQISDARWIGPFSWIRRRFRQFFEIPSLKTFIDMHGADIVLVKDDFSVALWLQAKTLGKPIVYLDAMFNLPKRFWRKWSAAINLRYADAILCYSEHQAREWAREFRLPVSRFSILPYCMDVTFYVKLKRRSEEPPFIIAVGRDLGRDYSTLVDAVTALDIDLKLVTMPYLLPDSAKGNSRVQVLEKISYAELFDLYSRATAAVIPLKRGICYPSGIRAVLESALLGVPTIATKTPILAEYLGNDGNILFVDAEDANSLASQIAWVMSHRAAAEQLAKDASEAVRRNFHMERFVCELEGYLAKLP